MKTVLSDNSLCVRPLAEGTHPKHIYKYIQSLGAAGIKYVEIDFRTVMLMQELPDNVGYIFRLSDPLFAKMAELYDFDYVLVTVDDLKKPLELKGQRILLELPPGYTINRSSTPGMMNYPRTLTDGEITGVRIRSSFSYMTPKEVSRLMLSFKNIFTVPVNICPLDSRRTALDMALKCMNYNIDMVTAGIGGAGGCACIQDLLFTLLAEGADVKDMGFSIRDLFSAEIYHHILFRHRSREAIYEMMKLLDHDILSLRNADTGERVRTRLTMKDSAMLHTEFVSALEKLTQEEDMPEDYAYDLMEAVKKYDASLYDPLLHWESKLKILN